MNQEQVKQLQQWKLRYVQVTPILLIILGLALIALGIVSQTADVDYEYISVRYDQCDPNNCKVTIDVSSLMKQPVFFSYEVSQFFQNTDKYFRSIPHDQLKGHSSFDDSVCDQYKTNKQMKKTLSLNGNQLNEDDIAIPCGIAAYAYMSDEFVLLDQNNKTINISDTNIAWEYDVQRYKNVNTSKQWIDMESERFMNWMRPSPLSRFRKLWGRINQDLPKGQYTVNIQIKTNEDAYKDTKKYVLLHNNGQYSDPILVITLPCLCVGPVMVIFGIVNIIYWNKKQYLVKKYSLY